MAFGVKTNEREGVRAVLRNAPGSASKVREVLDLIRGLDVASARDVLEFCERDAATTVGKLLDSAVANAEHNNEQNAEELFVSACFADEGRTQKRFKPRARGRAGKIFKRSSHITIIVSRLPEDRLARIKAKAESAQAERRSRRSGANADRGRRARVAASQASQASQAAPAVAHDHDHVEPTADEADLVEQAIPVAEPEAVADEAVPVEAAVEESAGEAGAVTESVEEAPTSQEEPTNAAPADTPKASE